MTDFATSASQDTLKLRLAAALPDHLPWALPLGALLSPTDVASLRQGGLLGFLAAMHAGGLGAVAARKAAARSSTFASDPCARFLAAAHAFADAASALELDDTPEVVVEASVQLLDLQLGFLRHPANNSASARSEFTFFRQLAAGADLALRRRTFLRIGRMDTFPLCAALARGPRRRRLRGPPERHHGAGRLLLPRELDDCRPTGPGEDAGEPIVRRGRRRPPRVWAAASYADGTLVKACRLHPAQLAPLRGACPLVTRVASQQGLFDQAIAQLTVLAPFLEIGVPLDESLLSKKSQHPRRQLSTRPLRRQLRLVSPKR